MYIPWGTSREEIRDAIAAIDPEDWKVMGRRLSDSIDQSIVDSVLSLKEEPMVFEQDGEYLTEENNKDAAPAPLTVERVGDEAHIPWKEWCLLVKALHNIGICLPPNEEE